MSMRLHALSKGLLGLALVAGVAATSTHAADKPMKVSVVQAITSGEWNAEITSGAKAAVAALKKFPEFNSSLDGDALVLKNYWHIGFAADTPNGLMVPVIRDVDKKTVPDIAKEMG